MIKSETEIIKELETLCEEMERRMSLFRGHNVTSIMKYNQKIAEENTDQNKLPYIVFLIDEYEPMMSRHREEFEHWIKRITAVAKFCGIHLILSTKHVTREVVSPVIEKNIPARIVFRTSDGNAIAGKDADKLLGRGDLLYSRSGTGETVRLQGAYDNY